MDIQGDLYLDVLTKQAAQALAFDESNDYFAWKKQVKEKFIELLDLKESDKFKI